MNESQNTECQTYSGNKQAKASPIYLLPHVNLFRSQIVFSARQHICYSALYAIARPSVCLSVTWVDQSKTLEVRIMQLLPRGSPHVSSFLTVNFTAKFQREHRERGCQI